MTKISLYGLKDLPTNIMLIYITLKGSERLSQVCVYEREMTVFAAGYQYDMSSEHVGDSFLMRKYKCLYWDYDPSCEAFITSSSIMNGTRKGRTIQTTSFVRHNMHNHVPHPDEVIHFVECPSNCFITTDKILIWIIFSILICILESCNIRPW
jgi:hypothetical protein